MVSILGPLKKISISRFFPNINTLHKRVYSDSNKSPLKNLLDNAATFSDKNVVDSELQWATSPYPNVFNENVKTKIDPRETSVILFPGQGSQYVGMAKDLIKYPSAQELFEIANEILKFDLLKLCLEGPESELNANCQLAVMVTSLACLEKLKETRPSGIEKCATTAGFSLGEITALVFAGAIPYEQAIRLVQIRSTAMEAASKDHPSGMITVMYGPDSEVNFAIKKAKEHCQELNIPNAHCQVANYLFNHCKVIAGSEPALKYIEKNYKEFRIRRVKRLNVSGAFHTEIMRAAVDPFRKALKLCDIQPPIISVISNVDCKPYRDANHIIKQLPKQIIKPVRWEQSMHKIFARGVDDHYPQTFAIGPGTSLKSMLKEVNAKAWDSCIHIQ